MSFHVTGIDDGDLVMGAGVTAGIAVATNLFGVLPQLFGVTAAWPVYLHGIDLPLDPMPRIYLRTVQEF